MMAEIHFRKQDYAMAVSDFADLLKHKPGAVLVCLYPGLKQKCKLMQFSK